MLLFVNHWQLGELKFYLYLKELEFHIGLCSVQFELPTLLPLVASGRIAPANVITHRMPLSSGPEAYRLFASRADGVGKVVLDPRH